MDATGKAELSLNDEFSLSGSGTFTETRADVYGPQFPCTGGALGRAVPFSVLPAPLTANVGSPPGADLSLALDITRLDSQGFGGYTCGPTLPVDFSVDFSGAAAWWDHFGTGGRHDQEFAHGPQGQELWVIGDWKYIGAGGLFAEKVYDDIGADGEHEKTTLTLRVVPP